MIIVLFIGCAEQPTTTTTIKKTTTTTEFYDCSCEKANDCIKCDKDIPRCLGYWKCVENECEWFCETVSTVTTTVTETTTTTGITTTTVYARCLLEPDSGPCEAAITRYYFDQEEGICKEFMWGGCQGTVPFEYIEGCKPCEDNVNRCELEHKQGTCKALTMGYYFDQKEGICKEFLWGGCGGVLPFETMIDCQKECGPRDGRLTSEEALEIAENSDCMQEGNLTDTIVYNEYTETWWIDFDIEIPGCNPACVVSEETKTAEINWRCTGLIPEL